MKRYAIPLSIGAVIVILIVLMFIGGPKVPSYTGGDSTEPPISEEWVRGNPAATVKLIEYSDFQCPACRAYFPMVAQLETEYASSVAFIYRNYPLYQIHSNADRAARVAEAAGLQGKFWEMHDELFEHQGEWDKLLDPSSAFAGYAEEIGLDVAKFKLDINSDQVKKLIADDYQRGQRAGVNGTPTFILNGIKIQNPNSIEEFRTLLNSAVGQ
jgi:protein-disulfide isomerase